MATAAVNYKWGWSIWDIPLAISLLPAKVSMRKSYHHEKKVIDITNKNDDKKVFKEVEESKQSQEVVSRRVQDAILSSDITSLEKIEFTSKAAKTKKWLDYVVYYITHSSANRINNIDSNVKELCNALSEYLGFGAIYEDTPSAELKFYDIESEAFASSPKFILSSADLAEIKSEAFDKKVEQRKIDSGLEEIEIDATEVPAPISPIIFNTGAMNKIRFAPDGTPMSLDTRGNLSDEMFEECEKYIKPLMDANSVFYNYEYKEDGYILLKTSSRGIYKEFKIDPGTTLGMHNYAVVAYDLRNENGFDTSTQLIPLQEYELLRTYMINEFFDPMAKDVMEAMSKYTLKHHQNNMMFDLSNIDMSNWSDEKKDKFDDILTRVYLIICSQVNEQGLSLPRFRFSSFTDYNKFSFISDMGVKIFLDKEGGHNPIIIEGLCGSVNGYVLIQNYNGSTVEFNLGDVVSV